ncbi:hypothetical protein [uncultured Methylobacterium sp.]|jgi:hypothetical protein|uniref:hypothetical protein n=1 Tax=uncultured Methylobacterium sp. TaxID=157278 RepID=UPI0035CA7E9A
MILLMFAALGGGLATVSVLAPFGAVAAAACAPIGGSLCAVLAAVYITRQREEAGSQEDLDAQADAMVATLRDLAARVPEARPAATTFAEVSADRARVG